MKKPVKEPNHVSPTLIVATVELDTMPLAPPDTTHVGMPGVGVGTGVAGVGVVGVAGINSIVTSYAECDASPEVTPAVVVNTICTL